MATPRRVNVRSSQFSSRMSTVPPASQAVVEDLPPYKKPSHPLDQEATRALRELQSRSLNDVKTHNKKAIEAITSSAESINDILREHTLYIARRQKKWDAGKSLDDKEQEEAEHAQLQQKVDATTGRLETNMRMVVDADITTQKLNEALDWLRQNAPRQLEEEYQTQQTRRQTQRFSQSQAESQRRRTQNEDGNEGSDEELGDAPSPGPTPLDGSRVALTGASEIFSERMEREKATYESMSNTARYARNNHYRDFKKVVHDAKYGDEGPPLGHEDTWFTERGSPAPGITGTQTGSLEDDDEIVMDKATISTRCPITFQQFKEPFTSSKCPHTFEKNAILDMIRTSAGRSNKGAKVVECPVPGCQQMLGATDLRIDPVLVRKIRRKQQQDEEQESSDEDEAQAPRGSTQQGASDDGDSDVEME